MNTYSTCPTPGVYQYTYPTFVDTPQLICVHFVTPDQQQAFVSYPNHQAAKLLSISWFNSVQMIKLDGKPQLMQFLEVTLPGWLKKSCLLAEHHNASSHGLGASRASERMAA
jgi:hypothetical protein